MSANAMQDSQSLKKHELIISIILAPVICVLLAFGPLSTAKASNEAFCSEIILQPYKGCHAQPFRKITRVNAEGREWPVCAGALNGNGVEVGGLVCKPECICYGPSFATNGNYDGTKFYQGRIYNNISTWDVLWGLEYYNP